MAPQHAVPSFSPLRAITHRISSTPSIQLPYVAQYLAVSIAKCKNVLSASQKASQTVDESSMLVHKLKTQISALLQDKSPHARYSAVILVKATVEAGGWNILQSAGPWVRALIGILGRPDPPSTKKLCIITITRIFLLTQEHQSLVREITTPGLAGFVTACLNLVKPLNPLQIPGSLLLTALQALSELIVHHPTSFRPYVPQLQAVILPLIAPTPSDPSAADRRKNLSGSVIETARRLLASLHVCGPKGTAGDEWAKSLQSLLVSTQRTADKVFRSLVEDWRPPVERADVAQPSSLDEVICDQHPGPLALPGWTGIYAGIERLNGLLQAVQVFMSSTTSVPIVLPVSTIMNLVDRVLSALQPSSTRSSRNRLEISRDEREGLFNGLPQLHVSAIGSVSLMISRLGHGCAATSQIALDQIFWVLESEHHDGSIRKAAYEAVSQILRAFGSSLPKSHVISLSRCVKLACADLLPEDDTFMQTGDVLLQSGSKHSDNAASSNADSYLKSARARITNSIASQDVVEAARRLLALSLTNLPPGYLSYAIRCQVDRTAILTNNKEVMLASVINSSVSAKGQKSVSSIVPFLARAYPEASGVEVLLRPQMPLLQARTANGEEAVSDMGESPYQPVPRIIDGRSDTHNGTFGLNGGRGVAALPAEPNDDIDGLTPSSKEIDQPSLATRPQSPFAVSYVSSKRDREEDIGISNGADDVKHATTIESEIRDVDSSIKRARLIDDATTTVEDKFGRPETAHADILDQTAGNPVAISSTTTPAYDANYDENQGDSDESDFVMPTLNLDPDTDEEDDDEEEDDD